ncbi:PhzF family phenazine biosynthesis protein [Ketobacter alkanivorans]|uniref:Isomerase n=1 Tax=Ketobacter alkanivorans TaxID=1917421 RepID=A0A2K9LN22_9GAMM|nr:PhzF family phenazine biosynthesis protein [Ketobacter alkanivorans]AUM13756.1 isomerase [Ketobacter alkanivorans]
MSFSIFQVDAFASRPFEGNPAAVVPLDQWLPDDVMQSIAAENNLAETAFFVPEEDGFRIRWFTPTVEVKLCGHATLAAAFVLYEKLHWDQAQVVFQSLSGPLTVVRSGGLLTLDFPAQPGTLCDAPSALVRGLGVQPRECLASEDYIVVLETEQQLAGLEPDMVALMELDLRGVAVTAPGEHKDFVVRFFGPRCGIPEDPVTGSAYTQLAPYWAQRLGRDRMEARQISARGGDVRCELAGKRVKISGSAVLFLEGEIQT